MQKRFKVTVSLKLVEVKQKARELHRVRKIFIKKRASNYDEFDHHLQVLRVEHPEAKSLKILRF